MASNKDNTSVLISYAFVCIVLSLCCVLNAQARVTPGSNNLRYGTKGSVRAASDLPPDDILLPVDDIAQEQSFPEESHPSPPQSETQSDTINSTPTAEHSDTGGNESNRVRTIFTVPLTPPGIENYNDQKVKQGSSGTEEVAREKRTLALESKPIGLPHRVSEKSIKASGLDAGGIVRTVFSLLVVVVLIFALKILVGKLMRKQGGLLVMLTAGGRAPSGVIEVLGRYPVSRGTTLVLLKIDKRILLLNQGQNGFQTLAEITDSEEVASILHKTSSEQSDTITDRFQSIMRRLENGHDLERSPLSPEIVDLTRGTGSWGMVRTWLSKLQGGQA